MHGGTPLARGREVVGNIRHVPQKHARDAFEVCEKR